MQKYRFGEFELDLEAFQLRLRGGPVKLERRPLDLLVMLVSQHGRLVAREDIISALWPGNVIIDFESGLNTLVRKVRSALGDSSEHTQFIETVPGRGYRFIAPVTLVATATPSAPVTEPPAAQPPRKKWRPAAIAISSSVVLAVAAIFGWRTGHLTSDLTSNSVAPAQTSAQPAADGVIQLAVLPFRPLTTSDRNESLELGMAETLIAGLNGTGRLQVSPLSSVRRFAGAENDAVSAARQLGVTAVLEGYIQRADNRLRVSARLLDAKNGRQLWADSYDEAFMDIFSVQDAIALRVRAALMPEFVVQSAGLSHKTHDAEAYQLFANGRFYLRRNEIGMRRSIEYFEQAVARDPGFAEAYVGLAESYSLLGVFGAMAPNEAFPHARAAVDRALALDPELGEAYASLGHIKAQYERDWPGAEAALRRAIELSPSFAPAQQWYGHYLAYIGRIEDGLAQVRKAQALEPASPSYGALVGMFLNYQRRYDEAIEQLTKTLETDADLDLAHTHLAVAYMYRGEYERAVAHLSRITSVAPGSGGYLGQIYAFSGRRADALGEIERLEALFERHEAAAHDIASIYGALGDADQAFLWLDRALQDRSQLLGWIRWNPAFDSIRADPRYAAFMRRLNLA